MLIVKMVVFLMLIVKLVVLLVLFVKMVSVFDIDCEVGCVDCDGVVEKLVVLFGVVWC